MCAASQRRLIEESRASVAAAVNTGLNMLYWRIGRRVRQEILKEGRAPYGDVIVSTLSRQLKGEYGRGFSSKNLRHMIRFREQFRQPGARLRFPWSVW